MMDSSSSLTVERFESRDPPEAYGLLATATNEGYGFVQRMFDEWEDRTNRFDRPGESLFLGREGNEIAGVCGLNIDPFLEDEQVGRLRHLYVLPRSRRVGLGTALVRACLSFAQPRFVRVRVRSFELEAAAFYAGLGFGVVEDDTATHSIAVTDHRQR